MILGEQLARAHPDAQPAAVAVGTFDGVHLGHRRLLAALCDEARSRRLRSVALTFRQQPRSVVRPGMPFSYLCEFEERLQLLREVGTDTVAVVNFDESIRRLSAEQFLTALQSALKMRVMVLGPGARQGHDQLDSPALQALGARIGFDVVSAPLATLDGAPVSSSAVRRALAEGRVQDAARMLGRAFSLTGPVIAGDRRGRELGFPTANLGPFAHATLPMDGIYATWAHLDGTRHMSATSIGVRPTFGQQNERRVEAYILDFAQDIYGRSLRLEFVERLRGEVAYSGPGPLAEQIKKDVAQARAILSTVPSPAGRGSG